ncbi:MAG: hypothetical protein TREMPRED_000398 [Tremellales sp. Tagirdzhanova-0007]|nr:MAG: hypothetical protein TREMPRED_000398 [Tremellales sp. Tagirdzhanova-0007]
MPPLFTATNVTTLLRKVVHAARYVHPRATVPISPASKIQRVRLSVQSALRETFTSLSVPANQAYALHPAQISSRGYASYATKLRGTPLNRAGHQFKTNGFRPVQAAELRGSKRITNVGVGYARTFATTGTFAADPLISATQANASIVLRAFSKLLQDDQSSDTLPRATPYTSCKSRSPMRREKRRLSARRGVRTVSGCLRSSGSCSIDHVDTCCIRRPRLSDVYHYFPLPARACEDAIDLPLLPEEIATPGRTSTLSIGLLPSDDALLIPTTSISFNELEVGVTVFANLTEGVVNLMTAFSIYGSTRVIPLLAKLESLGVVKNAESYGPATSAEVLFDSEGRPCDLLIHFHDRSELDVRAILGETLKEEQSTWYNLVEKESHVPLKAGVQATAMVEEEEDERARATGALSSSFENAIEPDPATLAWSFSGTRSARRLAGADIDPFDQQANTSNLQMPSPDSSGDVADGFGVENTLTDTQTSLHSRQNYLFPLENDLTPPDDLLTSSEAFSWRNGMDGSQLLFSLFSSPSQSPPLFSNIPDLVASQDSINSFHWSDDAQPSDDDSNLGSLSDMDSSETSAASDIEGVDDELMEMEGFSELLVPRTRPEGAARYQGGGEDQGSMYSSFTESLW